MKKFFRSKIGTVALVLALIGMVFVSARTIAQKIQIDREIRQLQARANQIKGDNQSLSDLVNYLQTDQYKEKAAREQLNLKKDGETVVALPKASDAQVAAASIAVPLSNPKKWYSYFFDHHEE